jgi:competence protein ComEC
MGPDRGGLAAAMTTGHEAFVPAAQVEALRAAGLAHIISISGLHMAIVGGFVFGLLRLAVAGVAALALRFPGRKIAAAGGMIATLGYLVLSGAPDPALRAGVTACAAFAAILADRRAISLRTLAAAAMVVLVIRPEAVTQPGFQMSFAATAALVALAEAWPAPVREISAPLGVRLLQGARTALVAGVLISLAAGLATGPFALQHFNRVALYGLPANLVSEPVSTLLLMPALALGVVLTPLGLGDLPLAAAGLGIDALNAVASAFAGLPGAERIVASAPPWALPVAFLGILFICLWRGPLRWLGLPLALAVNLAPRTPPPDLWVAHDAASAAVRVGGAAVFLRPDVRRFGAEVWARRRGLILPEESRPGGSGLACGAHACQPGGADPKVAVIWSRRPGVLEREFEAACAGADLVILRAERPEGPCAARIVLDQADFREGGAVELWRRPDGGWDALWAQPLRGQRPWVRAGSQ